MSHACAHCANLRSISNSTYPSWSDAPEHDLVCLAPVEMEDEVYGIVRRVTVSPRFARSQDDMCGPQAVWFVPLVAST